MLKSLIMAKDNYKNQEGGQSAEDKALDRFAELLIDKISTIQNDWKKPWFSESAQYWPKNMSGREYNGMNALMLQMHAEKNGYKMPVWATFDRLNALNYTKDKQGKPVQLKDDNGKNLPHVGVNKGEKSFPVFITVYSVVHKEDRSRLKYQDWAQLPEEERNKYNVYPKLKAYSVFNIDQSNLKEARPELYAKLESGYKENVNHDDSFKLESMDRLLDNQLWVCPIKPTKGDDAYYSISKDEIVIPLKEQFKSSESFYGNLFHEMSHSTGAESRFNRLKPTSFGSAEYAAEEMVSELSAAITANRYHMTKYVKDDSLPYLKSWLDNLREKPGFVKSLLTDVKRASSMITQRLDRIQLDIDEGRESKHEDYIDKGVKAPTSKVADEKEAAKAVNNTNEPKPEEEVRHGFRR